MIFHEEREEREYNVPHASEIRVEAGQQVQAGDALTSGSSNPQEISAHSGNRSGAALPD